jgi:hypothetical protein
MASRKLARNRRSRRKESSKPAELKKSAAQPYFLLDKNQQAKLKKHLGIQDFIAIVNPRFQLPFGAKQFFLFIDHEGSERYRLAQEFIKENRNPGITAVYYTVSWSEIVIQFCGTEEELFQFVEKLNKSIGDKN